MKERTIQSLASYQKLYANPIEEENHEVIKENDVCLKKRILALFFDMLLVISPTYVYICAMLLLFTSGRNYQLYDMVCQLLPYVCMGICCLVRPCYALFHQGCSPGYHMMGLSFVMEDHTWMPFTTVLVREICSTGILILGYTLDAWYGVLILYIANILFIIMDKQHRSLVDIALHVTCVP